MPDLASTTDLVQLFGEPNRVRLLALLARHELTVAELTTVTEMAQSRVSTHIAKLRGAGLLRDRRAGGSTLYSVDEAAMPTAARGLWQLVSSGLDDTALQNDRRRCEAVLRARARAVRTLPDSVTGELDRHYAPGRNWESLARGLLGLCDLGDVLDGGSGDGTIAQLLAPRARSVTCVDVRAPMVEAARARLERWSNVLCQVADLEALPFPDAAFDQVLLLNVLAWVAHPVRALQQAARVLRPGGRMVVTTLAEHEHQDITAAYGQLHDGFRPAALRRLLERSGLEVLDCEITSRERRAPYLRVLTALAVRERKSR